MTPESSIPLQTPEALAADLEAGLREPADGEPKRRGPGRPPGSKTKPKDPEPPPPPEFKIDPAMLVTSVHALGRSLTARFKVTEYQRSEAEDISKPLIFVIDYLIKAWGLNPATAPLVALILIAVIQVGPRFAEYSIRNPAPEGLPKPVPPKPEKVVNLS